MKYAKPYLHWINAFAMQEKKNRWYYFDRQNTFSFWRFFFLFHNTYLAGFLLETHNGSCTAIVNRCMQPGSFARNRLYSNLHTDPPSPWLLPAGCCIDWSTYTYLRHKMFQRKGGRQDLSMMHARAASFERVASRGWYQFAFCNANF